MKKVPQGLGIGCINSNAVSLVFILDQRQINNVLSQRQLSVTVAVSDSVLDGDSSKLSCVTVPAGMT